MDSILINRIDKLNGVATMTLHEQIERAQELRHQRDTLREALDNGLVKPVAVATVDVHIDNLSAQLDELAASIARHV